MPDGMTFRTRKASKFCYLGTDFAAPRESAKRPGLLGLNDNPAGGTGKAKSGLTVRQSLPPLPQADRRRLHSTLAAHAFAEARGTPLNCHAPLLTSRSPAFHRLGWARSQALLTQGLGRWLRRRGVPPAWIWTREDGAHEEEHLHLLLHLPPELREALRGYLHESLDVEPGHGAVGLRTGGMATRADRAGALAYAVKTLPGVEVLGIEPARCGVDGIKRCGMSETLGPKAQQAAGWVPLALPWLASSIWPSGPPQRRTTFSPGKGRRSHVR